MKLIYDVEDSPKFKSNLVFALQQLLAIIAATLLVPTLVNNISGTEIMSQSAALFGAGAGTLFYIWCTKRKSPVFLGSSFAFISPLAGACAFGYFGILLGAFFAALVYVIIAIVIHFVGTKWVDKLLPPVIIGPTVALIGLSLCSSAIQNLNNTSTGKYNLLAVLCGLIAFGATVFASVKGSKTSKLIPFIIGVGTGYTVASLFTLIGDWTHISYMHLIDYSPLIDNFKNLSIQSFFRVPEFTLVYAIKEGSKLDGAAVSQIA